MGVYALAYRKPGRRCLLHGVGELRASSATKAIGAGNSGVTGEVCSANGESDMKDVNQEKQWKVTLPDGRWTFVGKTPRSEARGPAKKDFGLPRLPVGTIIKEYF